MRVHQWKIRLVGLLLWSIASAVMGGEVTADKQAAVAEQAHSEYAHGAATAVADFASGKPGWHFYSYSNMPNGPDDPLRVRERDLFVVVMLERGIKPEGWNANCDPSSTVSIFAAGYNSVAEGLLKARFGPAFMGEINREVARRMKAGPAEG